MDDTISMRPPRDEDVPALVTLMNACDEVDLGYPDSDEEEAVWRWRTPGLDRDKDALVVVSGDEIVAYAVVHNGHADQWVHPQHRGRGIGTEVLNWIERRSLEQRGPGSELKQFVNERATAAQSLL